MPRATAFHRVDAKRRQALNERALKRDVTEKIKSALEFEGLAAANAEHACRRNAAAAEARTAAQGVV